MTPTPSPTRTAALTVLGMTCFSCETRVRRALEALPGVVGVGVNRADHQVIVAYDAAVVAPVTLMEAVGAAGYLVTAVSAEPAVPAATPAATTAACGCCAA